MCATLQFGAHECVLAMQAREDRHAVLQQQSDSEQSTSSQSSLLQRMTNTACSTYEAALLEYEELPRISEPVYVLSKVYSAIYDVEEIHREFYSKIWMTYRRGFPAIGGTGPTTDTGWGCMLRCGQMMLAQTLVHLHLGKDWHYNPLDIDPTYLKILRLFEDKKGSTYSIHQISQMGVTEGKEVGSWFGPNTVAQVMRKLAPYDQWSCLEIHIAMDNSVIISEIQELCRMKRQKMSSDSSHQKAVRVRTSKLGPADSKEKKERANYSKALGGNDDLIERRWKPLLLVVPLRLGLTEINPCYIRSVKECLTFKQSVGIIGGKPNHAHYFIGEYTASTSKIVKYKNITYWIDKEPCKTCNGF